MKRILIMFSLLLMVAGTQAKTRTVVFTTKPQMHCRKCENNMQFRINLLKGVKSVEANCVEQTVKVVFNDKQINEETLLQAFKAFGFDARQLKEGETVTEKEEHECTEEKKQEA